MAIQTFHCPNGHQFDAITGITIKDQDADRCPECGATELLKVIAAPHGDYRGNGEMSLQECKKRGDLEAVIESKRWIEAHSVEVLSGEIGIRENGPPELRPQCPEHLRKRYY